MQEHQTADPERRSHLLTKKRTSVHFSSKLRAGALLAQFAWNLTQVVTGAARTDRLTEADVGSRVVVKVSAHREGFEPPGEAGGTVSARTRPHVATE